jgi:hypothetical protein
MSDLPQNVWDRQIKDQITQHQIRLYAWETVKGFYQQGIDARKKTPMQQAADFGEDKKVAVTQIAKSQALLARWSKLATEGVEDLASDIKLVAAQAELAQWQIRQKIAEINYPVLKRLDDPDTAFARQETLKAAWLIPLWEAEIKRLESEIALAQKSAESEPVAN